MSSGRIADVSAYAFVDGVVVPVVSDPTEDATVYRFGFFWPQNLPEQGSKKLGTNSLLPSVARKTEKSLELPPRFAPGGDGEFVDPLVTDVTEDRYEDIDFSRVTPRSQQCVTKFKK